MKQRDLSLLLVLNSSQSASEDSSSQVHGLLPNDFLSERSFTRTQVAHLLDEGLSKRARRWRILEGATNTISRCKTYPQVTPCRRFNATYTHNSHQVTATPGHRVVVIAPVLARHPLATGASPHSNLAVG